MNPREKALRHVRISAEVLGHCYFEDGKLVEHTFSSIARYPTDTCKEMYRLAETLLLDGEYGSHLTVVFDRANLFIAARNRLVIAVLHQKLEDSNKLVESVGQAFFLLDSYLKNKPSPAKTTPLAP